jgi:surfeit locus 1 family protein
MAGLPVEGATGSVANSTASRPAGLRGGVLVPSLAAAAALAVLVSLGLWQLDRLAWKEGLIATLEQRLSASPVALPPPAEWPLLTAARDEFLRVTLRAAFQNDREALVYTGGSSMREATGGPGYWVFTPARLADGALVMVNRGFVPEGRQDPASRAAGQTAGPVDMIGVLRWPEPPGLFTPNGDPARNIWFARDSAAIAAAKGISSAPFYVELESPEPPGGLPHAGRLQPNLPNNHFGYALTWLGLAAVLVGVYIAWLFSGWRKREVERR